MGKPSMMLSLPGLVGKEERDCFLFHFQFFFCKGYIPTLPVALIMPSKYSVALSLDSVTFRLWESLPIGERSKRIREALVVADLVVAKDADIAMLQDQLLDRIHQVRKLKMSNQELRAFGCMCVVGNVSVGDLE